MPAQRFISRVEEMDKLLALKMFVETVRCGGYSAAARKLGIATSSVARQVAALENQLGATLITRSTRSNKPTDLGRSYFEEVVRILDVLDAADSTVSDRGDEAKGILRLSAPVEFGRRIILPHLSRFLDSNPKLELRLSLSDDRVDPYKDQVDLSVRLGSTVSSEDVVCNTVGHFQRWIVASPSYLERHGWPAKPCELSDHNCLRFDYGGMPLDWGFEIAGSKVMIAIRGRLLSNNADVLKQATISGQGISLLADWLVANEVRSGRLTRLLTEYEANPMSTNSSINLIYLPTYRNSARVRAFSEFFRSVLTDLD